MTVTTETISHSYIPTTAMLAEALPFEYLRASDLVVIDSNGTVQVLGTDYEITGNGRTKTGSIRTLRVFTAGLILTITRDTKMVQEALLSPFQPMPAETIERELDRRAMIEQEMTANLADLASRAVTVKKGQSIAPFDKAVFAGKILGFDAAGNNIVPITLSNAEDGGLRSDLANTQAGASLVILASGQTVQQGFNASQISFAQRPTRSEMSLPLINSSYKITHRAPPSYVTAKIPSLRVFSVHGAGPKSVTHNCHALNTFRDKWWPFMGGLGDTILDRYVDWATGSDINIGYADAPFKTVKKAVSVAGVGTVWLLGDTDEILDLNGINNLAGGQPRAVQIRPETGRIKFTAPGEKAQTVDWSETEPGSQVWTFANALGRRAESILYSRDGDWRNAKIIPFKGVGASAVDAKNKVSAEFNGWSQLGATGDVFLRFHRSMNINTNKAKFKINWSSPSFLASPHKISAGRYYFKDCDFVGGDGVLVQDAGGFASWSVFDNCTTSYMTDKGWNADGNSFVLLQDCDGSRNSGDGVGWFGNAIIGMIDSVFDENGPEITYAGVTNAYRNRQGVSAHDNGQCFMIGVRARENFGQNVANTTINPETVVTYAIGCDFMHPGQTVHYTSAAISLYSCAESYGVGYWDSCVFGGLSATYGLVAGSGQVFAFRNALHGVLGDGSGVGVGGQLVFDPWAVL